MIDATAGMAGTARVAGAAGVAGVVLAAGAGTRLGQPKATVALDGELLGDRAAQRLIDAGCDPVVVVLGAADVPVRPPAVAVHNPDWASGMGSSLRRGLAALAPEVEAAVIVLADQPGVSAEAVRRLLSAYAERPATTTATGGADDVAVVASYDGRPRNPVLLPRTLWAEVGKAAVGDTGARPWLRAHPEQVRLVSCDDCATADDLDVPADLTRLTR